MNACFVPMAAKQMSRRLGSMGGTTVIDLKMRTRFGTMFSRLMCLIDYQKREGLGVILPPSIRSRTEYMQVDSSLAKNIEGIHGLLEVCSRLCHRQGPSLSVQLR